LYEIQAGKRSYVSSASKLLNMEEYRAREARVHTFFIFTLNEHEW
jgi:hypothetical protein